MKKLTWLPLAVVLLFYLLSCKRGINKEEKETKKITAEQKEYSIERLFVTEEGCSVDTLENCTHILLEYPVFESEKMTKANSFLNHRMADVLGFGDAESNTLVDLEAAAQHILNDYKEFKKEFPESPQVWNVRMISHVIYENEDVVCLKMVSESYMGGAHGSLNTSYMTFDINTSAYVNLLDRVENKELFISLAEQKFRKKRNLTPGEDLEKAGFGFPDNEFALPANIGIDDNGYLLHYNPYEVAPYSMGPTNLFISFDELKKKSSSYLFRPVESADC